MLEHITIIAIVAGCLKAFLVVYPSLTNACHAKIDYQVQIRISRVSYHYKLETWNSRMSSDCKLGTKRVRLYG